MEKKIPDFLDEADIQTVSFFLSFFFGKTEKYFHDFSSSLVLFCFGTE